MWKLAGNLRVLAEYRKSVEPESLESGEEVEEFEEQVQCQRCVIDEECSERLPEVPKRQPERFGIEPPQPHMSYLQRMQLVETQELPTIHLHEVVKTERVFLIPAEDEMTDVGRELVFRVKFIPPAHVLPISNFERVVPPALGMECPRGVYLRTREEGLGVISVDVRDDLEGDIVWDGLHDVGPWDLRGVREWEGRGDGHG